MKVQFVESCEYLEWPVIELLEPGIKQHHACMAELELPPSGLSMPVTLSNLSLACRIIRTLSCDRYIVNMALAQARR